MTSWQPSYIWTWEFRTDPKAHFLIHPVLPMWGRAPQLPINTEQSPVAQVCADSPYWFLYPRALCRFSPIVSLFIWIPVALLSLYLCFRLFIPVPLSHQLLRKICIFFQRAIPSKFQRHQLLKTPTQFIIGWLVPCMSVQVLTIAVNPHPVKPRGRQRLYDLPVGIRGLCPTASAY